VGGHDLDGVEHMIRLGLQLIGARSSSRIQREVKHVVIERQL